MRSSSAFSRNRTLAREADGFELGPVETDPVCTDVWLPLDMQPILGQRKDEGSREMAPSARG